ncbi:MAG: tripartite tricarboxylate transporter TctB family protein [Thermodesulfobacteriota bacterium]
MGKFNNDQLSAMVWLTLGLIMTIASIRYKLGTLASPGTGFMPFLSSLAIAFFSFIGLVHATLRMKRGVGWKPTMSGLMWGKSLIVIVALLAYTLLLTLLGFSLCTALFIGFLLRTVKPQGWLVVIAGSILTALGAYGIFEVWLKVQLPKGPWGF